MDVDWIGWLNLIFRWLHLVAGIAWIGSSFYFVWLDNSLETPKEKKKGLSGELWAVHGGGFYHNQKYMVAPENMPENLHWFKWEAYTTWISGAFLMAIIYYYGAEIYMIDTEKVDLTQTQAILLSLAFIVAGWLVYDGLCRSPLGKNTMLFGVLWFGTLTAATYVLTNVFSDRAAFIHIGVMIGTAMVANVFFVIIPNQKKVVADLTAGREPDPALGKAGKQRSMHNNYMTLPVLLIMISNHYPQLTGHHLNWLLLAGIGAVGFMIRRFFNLKHVGQVRYEYAFWSVVGFSAVVLVSATSPIDRADATAEAANIVYGEEFLQVQQIVEAHCVSCHAAKPDHAAFDAPPGGVILTSPSRIRQNARLIHQQAVASNLMPMGNDTEMSDAERAILGAWIDAGAQLTAAAPPAETRGE